MIISWIMRSARASGSSEGFIQGCGAGLAVPAGACARATLTGLTKPRARTIQATNVGRGKLMIAVFLFVRTNQYTCGGRRALDDRLLLRLGFLAPGGGAF